MCSYNIRVYRKDTFARHIFTTKKRRNPVKNDLNVHIYASAAKYKVINISTY